MKKAGLKRYSRTSAYPAKRRGKQPRPSLDGGVGRAAARAAAGLAFFLVIVAALSFYAARVQRAENVRDYGTDWSFLPKPVNHDLGRPMIASITVDRGATIKWQPAGSEEVLGYNLYRFKGDAGPGEKVNAAIILDNFYFDDEGTVFNLYSVAAVDRGGLEGPVSEAIAAVEEPKTLSGMQPTAPPEVMKDIAFSAAAAPGLPPEIRDCTSPGMNYHGTWYLEHYPEVYGGGLMVTPYEGDYLTYTFEGTGFNVISVRHWNYGIMDIYVDGALRGSADLYSDRAEAQARVFSLDGLSPGPHNLKIACSGLKNPGANFTFIAVDAIEVR